MKMKKTWLIPIVILVLLALVYFLLPTAHADGARVLHIELTVFDANNQSLAGASVTVLGYPKSMSFNPSPRPSKITSNSEGKANFSLLAPHGYKRKTGLVVRHRVVRPPCRVKISHADRSMIFTVPEQKYTWYEILGLDISPPKTVNYNLVFAPPPI